LGFRKTKWRRESDWDRTLSGGNARIFALAPRTGAIEAHLREHSGAKIIVVNTTGFGIHMIELGVANPKRSSTFDEGFALMADASSPA
jgi:hypothetical protein